MNGERLRNVEPGDLVERVLFGMSPTKLKVTQVTDEAIVCGKQRFSRETGYQVGDSGDLNTSSFIKPTSQIA